MDCCRNISISGGLPSEYQPEQLLSSSCSKLGSLDDLFSSNNMEEEGGDVSLEWLSIFVEDCFSSSGNYSCLPPAEAAPPPNELQKTTTTDIIATAAAASMPSLLHSAEKTQQNTTSTTTSSLLQKKKNKFVVPISKARSKRKRGPVLTNKYSKTQQVTSTYWSHQAHIPLQQNFPLIMTSSSSDPPLLQQAYWLADSELLILPMKEQDTSSSGGGGGRRSRSEIYKGDKPEGGADDEEVVQEDEEDNKRRGSLEGSKGQQHQQQPRRCSHCLAQRTPQWRAGPLGPKTLCNACGVRYKSGRLLPEYRPAKSPTFVTYKHSNSHKKVMELRMAR